MPRNFFALFKKNTYSYKIVGKFINKMKWKAIPSFWRLFWHLYSILIFEQISLISTKSRPTPPIKYPLFKWGPQLSLAPKKSWIIFEKDYNCDRNIQNVHSRYIVNLKLQHCYFVSKWMSLIQCRIKFSSVPKELAKNLGSVGRQKSIQGLDGGAQHVIGAESSAQAPINGAAGTTQSSSPTQITFLLFWFPFCNSHLKHL